MVRDAGRARVRGAAHISTKGSGGRRSALTSLDDLEPSGQLAALGDTHGRDALVGAHLRWDPVGPALSGWLLAAATIEEGPALVQRRADQTRDVAVHRVAMDLAEPDRRAALCDGYRDRLAADGSDADASYLVARCEDVDGGYLARWREFPEHGFLAWAATHELAHDGDWDEAVRSIEVAHADPAVGAAFGSAVPQLVASMRRMAAPQPSDADLADLVGADGWLDFLLALERGTAFPEPFLDVLPAWLALADGDLESAVDGADPAYPLDRSLLRLVGASDGASDEAIARALALPREDGESLRALWATIALAAREGATLPWRDEVVRGTPEFAAAVLPLLDDGTLAADPEALDRAVAGRSLEELIRARLVGTIVLGKAAPEHWRAEVKGLMLVGDRPYFR